MDEIFNPETGVGKRIKDFYIQKITNVVDRNDETALSDYEINHKVPSSISLVSNPKIALGEQGRFAIEVEPSICGIPTIQWESSNYDVISIDPDGYFMAKSLGNATVTAWMVEDTSVSSSISLEVVSDLPIKTTLEVSPASLELVFGRDEGVITVSTNSTGEISFVSSDHKVCWVDTEGLSHGAFIEPFSAGNATITVSVAEVPGQYTAASATCTVVVSQAVPEITLYPSIIDDLSVGSSETIDVQTESIGAVSFSSSDTGVATVNGEGEVTGVSAGEATITVSVAEVPGQWTAASAECSVSVRQL